jgi:hypothetical protein
VTTSDAATLTNKTIDSITNLVGADHIHYKIKANATITKGQTLKAVGYNAGEAAIEVVPISSASDIAVGIAYQDLASGAFGAAINTGLLIGVKPDFAGWALGDVLYPDPATGGLTKTKPTSGTYQACAYIMRVQSNNGVLLCEFTEPQQVLASTNTANTAVLRDGSGNFAAGTVTAALTGNASTATALATARTINGVSFNGTADITVTAAAGTLTGATLAAGVTASSLTSVGTLANLTVTNPITGSVTGSSGSSTGNAATATALQTARTINGVSFNGTADITVTAAAGTLSGATLAAGVTASSLTSVGTLGSLTVTNPITGSVTGSSGSTTGNAATATTLQTARNINGVSFNGSADITVTAAAGTLSGSTLAAGVTASSLTSVGTLTSLGVSGTLAIPVTITSSGASTSVSLNNTNANAWGSNLAIATGGTAAGYFGTIGSLLGTTAQDLAVYATSGNGFRVYTNGNNERARIDASGNLGLGVTPSAWSGLGSALQFNLGSLVMGGAASVDTYFSSNAFWNGSAWTYIANASATQYLQNVSGDHRWRTAASGTAGNAISFVQAMTLDASGNLGVGTTPTNYGAGYTQFVVRGSTIPIIDLTVDTSRTLSILAQAAQSTIKTVTNTPLIFATNDTDRARIPAAGGMVVGTAALATSATDGFLYVPTCAGTPTGTPTTQTGTAPIIVDTTNHKLYFFSGGTWRDAGP